MRWLIGLLLCLAIAIAASGCGPKLSEKDMGTIIYEIPEVKGADKPYEMPELASWKEEDERSVETEDE